MATTDKDTRVWRYRISGVNPNTYTAVILDPIYLNQNATKDVSLDVINKAKAALQEGVVIGVKEMGAGKFVFMADDPIFRNFWENGKLILSNAVFFNGK